LKPSASLTLRLLREHPAGLTQLEVLALGGGDSLAQRVHELRAEGFDIRSAYETTPRGARICRYSVHEPAPQPVPLRGVQVALFPDRPVGAPLSPRRRAVPAAGGMATG
jgi:hypothetical protein